MEQNRDNTNEVFMEITSKKIEKQEKKFALLEEQIKELAENKVMQTQINSSIELLKEEISKHTIPIEVFKIFSTRLNFNSQLLNNLAKNKIQHHHKIPYQLWIIIVSLFAAAFFLSGWYVSSQKVADLIANDTKYRYLKQDSSQKYLQIYLYRVDSFYQTIPDFRTHVIEEEKRLRDNFEKIQKATALRVEANNVEKSVKLK